MRIRTQAQTNARKQTRSHAHSYTRPQTHTYMQCMHANIYIYPCKRLHIHILQAYTRIHTQTHIHNYVCTHMRRHIVCSVYGSMHIHTVPCPCVRSRRCAYRGEELSVRKFSTNTPIKRHTNTNIPCCKRQDSYYTSYPQKQIAVTRLKYFPENIIHT